MKKFYIAVFIFFMVSCHNCIQPENLQIKNAQNEDIYVRIDGLENISFRKLAIIQHGLASHMNHIAVQKAKQAFLDNHYVVITFDSRYSLGKGNNDVEKVQLKTFTEDLETVANWAKKQPFYSEPFALAGHSLGGASVIEFASKYPKSVKTLIPITPVISGKRWEQSCMENMTDFCRLWKRNGTYQYTDAQNHKTATIPFSVFTSCQHYNAYALAPKISSATLLIGAENDIVVDPNDIRKLSHTILNSRFSIINSAGHNFENTPNQVDLYQTIFAFLN